MILIFDEEKTQILDSYPTLVNACKCDKLLKYQYLKDIKLNATLRKYKDCYVAKDKINRKKKN